MITLDEAIKHCKEVAEQKDLESGFDTDNERYIMTDNERADCKECANEHRQLAEWLTELKQFKEQESCEDVISRSYALNVINLMKANIEAGGYEAYSQLFDRFDNVPPATPKRKVGEWIKKNNDYFDWYECSECGYGSDGEMKYNRLCDVRTKFCPDCGSQNLEVENEIN